MDITVISDDEIMGHRSMAALTLLQKHIHRRDLMALLDRLATVLLKEFTTEQQLASLINYLVQVGETTNAKTVVRTLAQRVPQHGGTLMTVAQQLEQAGIDIGIGKGIEQGIEQGIDIGKQTALRNVAKAMLDSGFELEVVMTITGLTADQIKSLC